MCPQHPLPDVPLALEEVAVHVISLFSRRESLASTGQVVPPVLNQGEKTGNGAATNNRLCQHLWGDELFRVGFGYDAHRLVEGRPLILGGVSVPHSLGLLGHSDADVLTHALIDALLGALCKGDIGQHFPDTDPAYKNASSLMLLKKAMTWVREEGYRVGQVDSTIVAEEPRLAQHIGVMREKLSRILGILPNLMSIKAKTSEKMGFCGREEGIEAFVIVSLLKSE